ncbi:hypothetical protein AAES_05922 [Amazona aestiva]|uniref:Uncharacterized protein n=1 Tax=Amazona aestiva TaxID=12930 RepID=A0A0Q3XAS3_AMAAE|nr:hypothetical protein AAES_05922 [Amazona aestiva]
MKKQKMACGLREDILVDERHNCGRAKGISCEISSTSGTDHEELARIEKDTGQRKTSLGVKNLSRSSFIDHAFKKQVPVLIGTQSFWTHAINPSRQITQKQELSHIQLANLSNYNSSSTLKMPLNPEKNSGSFLSSVHLLPIQADAWNSIIHLTNYGFLILDSSFKPPSTVLIDRVMKIIMDLEDRNCWPSEKTDLPDALQSTHTTHNANIRCQNYEISLLQLTGTRDGQDFDEHEVDMIYNSRDRVQ